MKKLTMLFSVCLLLSASANVSLASGIGERGSTKTDLASAEAFELNVVEFNYVADFSDAYIFSSSNGTEVSSTTPLPSFTTAILADEPIPLNMEFVIILKGSCYLSPFVDNSYRWKVSHFHSC